MGFRSLAVAVVRVVLYGVAVVAGLMAAFVSQVSSPDYHAVARTAVGLAVVAAMAAAGFAAVVRSPARWLPALPAALGLAGAAEIATRVWG